MNKKKIFSSIAVLAIAAMAAFNANVNIQDNGLSDIVLNNIEALGTSEDDGSVRCCPDKGDTCAVGSTNVSDYDEC